MRWRRSRARCFIATAPARASIIDISLLDAYFHYHDWGVQTISASGGAKKAVRTGQHYSSLCPAGMFKGKETYIFIFAWLDHHWVKFCEMMGRPELGQDPRFVDNDARLANLKEVIKIDRGMAGADAERRRRGRGAARGADSVGAGADARSRR